MPLFHLKETSNQKLAFFYAKSYTDYIDIGIQKI